jgi:hypothetical protein
MRAAYKEYKCNFENVVTDKCVATHVIKMAGLG